MDDYLNTSAYRVPLSAGVQSYIEESLEPITTLHFVGQNGTTAFLEAIEGSVAEDVYDLLFESIEASVDVFAGYIEPADEDHPNEIFSHFESDSVTHHQAHLFKFGMNRITLHLTVTGLHVVTGVEFFRSLLSSIEINENLKNSGQFGDLLEISIVERTNSTRLGNYLYFHSAV